jgi:hypothetical protein
MLSKENYQDRNISFVKVSLLVYRIKIRNLAFLYNVAKFCLIT